MKASSVLGGLAAVVAVAVGIFLYKESQASTLYATWHAANSKLNLKGKNVLVVGGTQGIGAGVATRFAQLGASVAIAGRNEKLANELIENWKKEQKESSQEFTFFRFDASLVKDVSRFSQEAKNYFQQRGGLHYLIQSQGILTTDRFDTSEGLDNSFAITAFSKWTITNTLLPVLKDSVIYILAPSTRGEVDLNDVEFRNASTLTAVFSKGIIVDSITKEFQKRNDHLRFYHLYPGVVKTDLFTNSGWNSLLTLLMVVGRAPVVYADHPVYIATHPNEFKPAMRLSEKNQEYSSYPWLENDAGLAKLFEWCEKKEAAIKG